jgi:transketolase
MATDELCVNTIRTLAMDAVQKANSGHPGTPMAMAPVAYTVWQHAMRTDPRQPHWPNRDRFILSCGHASMLLYAMLHVTGIQQLDAHGKPTGRAAVTLDDLKQFRQLNSLTPGHPEYRHTTGVEATTGPLGQGVGMSVGFAIAERWKETRYNKPDFKIVDHDIYVICSDGDMEEGISHEAGSIAGHLGLSNLCWIYDSNQISIEGNTALAFSEDVAARFLAYGWNVHHLRDANDMAGLQTALAAFKAEHSRPTMIVVESHIGYGAPHKQDTAAAHGEALGEDEVRAAKKFYGWPEDAHFLVPDGVYEHFAEGVGARGAAAREAWENLFGAYRKAFPDLAEEFERAQAGELPKDWQSALPVFPADAKGLATRDSGGKVLNALAAKIPYLLGGAADLSPSTKTNLTAEKSFEADNYSGRNFHFGIREHAMGTICNGMVVSGVRPFGSGFLIFSDYMREPIRLSALMGVPVAYVFTHDSIGLGEDGPTHQPIEQLASLRAIPNMLVLRPGDANEVAECWRIALSQTTRPSCFALSRQAMPTYDRTKFGSAEGVARGAYILAEAEGGKPDVILMGTGSEVQLCVHARELLAKEGIHARVVSMPCWELFDEQDEAYRDHVLPPDITARVSVEQAAIMGWEHYTLRRDAIIGMHRFGASAPIAAVLPFFGFTPEKVAECARAQVARVKGTSSASKPVAQPA